MPHGTRAAVLLAGCGDIACRLAPLLQDTCDLTGLRRQPATLPHPIQPLAADLCDGAAVSRALAGRQFDDVVITLTPGERTELRYRQVYIDGTRHLLAALRGNPRVLFVSSTSVYGQDSGEAVDEDSPAAATAFSGRCLREAETLVADSGLPHCIVRFSGIYGPGRARLLRMVRDGRVDPLQSTQWTNRIHADDCARVLAFLLRRWQAGNTPHHCYIASDPCPTQAGAVWQWLADALGVADPLSATDWQQRPPTGKRCSPQRLLTEGFTFLHPDFRSGYRALLTQDD